MGLLSKLGILRKRPDERTTLGGTAYLLMVVAGVSVGIWGTWKMNQSTSANALPPGRVENMDPVRASIQRVDTVQQQQREKSQIEKSDRGVQQPPAGRTKAPETARTPSFDPASDRAREQASPAPVRDFAALADEELERRKRREEDAATAANRGPVEMAPSDAPRFEGASKFPVRIGEVVQPTGRGQPGGGGQSTGQAVVIYAGDPANENGGANVPDGFAIGMFLPRGTEIPLYVLDTYQSDEQQTFITFGVAASVMFQGKYLLPFGTRMFGSMTPAPRGQRVSGTIHTIQFPDGRELSVSGMIKGLDGHTGVPAYYIAKHQLPLEIGMVAGAFTKAYLDTLQQYQERKFQLSVGSAGLTTANPTIDGAQAAIQATSKTIQDRISEHLSELSRRYSPYLTVIAGTECKLVLLAPLDLSRPELRPNQQNSGASTAGNGLSQIGNGGGPQQMLQMLDAYIQQDPALSTALRAATGANPGALSGEAGEAAGSLLEMMSRVNEAQGGLPNAAGRQVPETRRPAQGADDPFFGR